MGCLLSVEFDETGIKKVTGNQCKRGELYAAKEVITPKRIVTSIVPVLNGVEDMVSVKTAIDIPKELIKQCVIELKNIKVEAPVEIGQVILENVCGTNVCVIATKSVERKK
jgi:CxxC motif-containing protein